MTSPPKVNAAKRIDTRLPITADGMRIGLLGGSFNPAHEGHLHISEIALKRCNLDRIWWLVTPGNPMKSHQNLAPINQRIKKAREIANNPRIIVTGFEANLPSSYTADTLKFLKKRLPTVSFVWLMGADNLINFHHWQNWQDIFMCLPIIVFNRPNYPLKALSSPAGHTFRAFKKHKETASIIAKAEAPAWVFLPIPLSTASSTTLRKNNEKS